MKTAKEAVNTMKAHSKAGTTGFGGWCLRTVRQAWGLPGTTASAIKAWNAVPANKRHTDPKKAPIGAVHFFDIGKHGHIVMQSELKGKVWGTDAPVFDKVGLVNLAWFSKHWGAKYLGWSAYLNGKDLPVSEMPKATLASVVVGVPTRAIPAKNPVAYNAAASAAGGGVDTVPAKKAAAPAKKATAKKVAKKPGNKRPV